MTVPLFFADADRLRACAVGDVIDLDGPEGHHAAAVRRLTVGEKLELADGNGLLCSADVTAVMGRALRARVLARTQLDRPQPRVTVVQALAKGDRDERAVEALTEVGVDAMVPWQASRSIARWNSARAEKGVAAWRTTAREAAKQTRRPWLVDVHALESTGAVASRIAAIVAGGGQAVVLHETATRPLLDVAVHKAGEIVLVIGPEGGIADDELADFETAGAIVCRLGQTVLRTSTASTVALALVLAESGRWG